MFGPAPVDTQASAARRLGTLLATAAFTLCAACAAPAQRPGRSVATSDPTTNIYLVRRSWHVDIGLGADDISTPLDAVLHALPGARFVLFGFGDRHYLLAKHHGPFVTLGALWPGDGLMLLTGLIATPQAAFGADSVIVLPVSSEQASRLEAFIWASLSRPQSGALTPLAPGPYGGSLYYAAVPRYSGTHTCNTWAAEALKAAGLPFESSGVEFASQLWEQAHRVAPPAAAGGATH
jgi:uncharacterized protein (TIGR02117 family)